jgi:hypothetical protein
VADYHWERLVWRRIGVVQIMTPERENKIRELAREAHRLGRSLEMRMMMNTPHKFEDQQKAAEEMALARASYLDAKTRLDEEIERRE